jgi:hypothetical protein
MAESMRTAMWEIKSHTEKATKATGASNILLMTDLAKEIIV